MTGVLVGCGRDAVHTSPSISLELMCGPFTPYVSLVGKLSSACIINHHVRSCQQHIIKSIVISSKQNNITVNETTRIAHSLTQSGVQGVPSMPLHPHGPKPCTLNETESTAPIYIKVVKTSCHLS